MDGGFRDFYANSFSRVFSAVYAVSGEREVALDATQGAFERAFSRWNRLGREAWVEGWVMTTAMNLSRRHYREASRLRRGTHSVTQDPEPNTDRIVLVQSLRELPFRQRQAVVLFYLADLPVMTVADLMQLSEGTVKAHLAHARKSLRKRLEAIDV